MVEMRGERRRSLRRRVAGREQVAKLDAQCQHAQFFDVGVFEPLPEARAWH